MKLIHLTDIHLTPPPGTIAGRDPIANFDRALEHALSHHPDAAAIFVTGDLSDWGDAEDYARLRARLSDVALPVHLAIGNHDDRATFLEYFPHLGADGFVQYRIDLPGHVALILDTWEAGTHAGRFCDARAAWLDARLAEAGQPVLLFLHHNPAPIGIAPMDRIMLRDADRLGAVLERHPGRVRHIFHGHCHLPLSGSFHGVPFSAPRGTNHAGWADFSNQGLLAGSDLPEAYAVALFERQSILVHMIEYGYEAAGGAIRREGSPDKADWDRLTMVR
ncbi:MAG: phosphodiesterase [Pseudomonadota bacterium]